jgi:hypothetical protein
VVILLLSILALAVTLCLVSIHGAEVT